MIRHAAILLLCIVPGSDRAGAQTLFVPSPLAVDSIDQRDIPDVADSAAATRSARPKAAAGNPLWGVPLRTLIFTQQRPIFSPSRRPKVNFVPVAVAAPAPPPVQSDTPLLNLIGIVVGTHESIGVFLDQTTKDVVRLRTGEGHRGWILNSVGDKEATLRKENRTVVLALPSAEMEGAAPSRQQDR